MHVAEVGPGRGGFADRCLREHWRYVGIEAGEEVASDLRSRGLDIIHSQVPPLPVPPASYDLIYSAHVIEHLRSGYEVAELLSDCRRALKPGGRLILVYPDATIWGRLFWEADYTHHWPASRRRLRQVADDVGLRWIDSLNLTLGLSGRLGAVIRAFGCLIPWRVAGLLPMPVARALVGLRILLMSESVVVLEEPRASQSDARSL